MTLPIIAHERMRCFTRQKKSLGMDADLDGRFQYIDHPTVAIWTGIADYPFLRGLVTVRIPGVEPFDSKSLQTGLGSHMMSGWTSRTPVGDAF